VAATATCIVAGLVVTCVAGRLSWQREPAGAIS
jgi:hypothetical protein